MTHVSRPLRVGLVAVLALAAVWLVALRGHSKSGGAPSATVSQPAPQPSQTPATTPYTGPAPGVAGLTRAIERARGAVALSERSAHQVEQQSAQASSSSTPSASRQGSSTTAGATASSATHSSKSRPASTAHARSRPVPAKAHRPTGAQTKPPAAGARSVPAPQAAVEAQLAQGKIVAILFWDPVGVVDRVVHGELQSVQREVGGRLAVHDALPSQVGAFGSITRAIPVFATPTIVFVNRRGRAAVLSGLTEAFALRQTLNEVSH